MLPPREPTTTEKAVSDALYAHEAPWTGERAEQAAAGVYDALDARGLIIRTDREVMIVRIAERIEEIQRMLVRGYCGPSAAQLLEQSIRQTGILK